MASRAAPGLGLQTDWNLGEDGWKTGMDANLLDLSVLVNTRILAFVATLPDAPVDGDAYVVTTGGNAKKIAVRDLGVWKFWTPKSGYEIFNLDDQRNYVFDGTDWVYPFATLDAAVATAVDKAEEATDAAALAAAAAAAAGEGVAPTDTIAVMGDLDTAAKTAAFVKSGGRAGLFYWDPADLSAMVAIDTAKGSFVPPGVSTGKATNGSQGAWRRQRGPLSNYHKTTEYGDNILAAIATAAALGGGTVEVNKKGSILLPPGFIKPANVEFVGLGAGNTFLVPDGFDSDSDFLAPSPTLMGGRMVMICADANNYAMTTLPSFTSIGVKESAVTFASAHGLKAGDQIAAWDGSPGSLNSMRYYYYKGERFTVMAVDGLKVYLDKAVLFNWSYGANSKFYKVHSWTGKFGGFTLDLTGVYSGSYEWEGIKLFRAQNAEIDDIQVFNGKYGGIEIDQCLDTTLTRIRCSTREDGTQPENAYPVLINNSTNVWIDGGSGRSHWVGGDLGGWDVAGATTNFNCGYKHYDMLATELLAAGIHGNSIACGYENCKIDGGVLWGGYGSFYRNCDVNVRRGENSVMLYGSECGGGRHVFEGGSLTSAKNAGGINFGGVFAQVDAHATEPVEFIIQNTSIYAPSEEQLVYLGSAEPTVSPSLRMSNVVIQADSMGTHGVVRAFGNSTTPAYFILEGITGLPAGKKLYEFNSGYNPALKKVQGEPAVRTIGAGSTIDFEGVDAVMLGYGSSQTISSFANAVPGKVYDLLNTGAGTVTIDRTNARLNGSANIVLDTYDVVQVAGFTSSYIVQASPRSDNG